MDFYIITGRVVDSESDYDSEMDDFIDDGEVDMDYSKHIKEIFGYDKSRFVFFYDTFWAAASFIEDKSFRATNTTSY